MIPTKRAGASRASLMAAGMALLLPFGAPAHAATATPAGATPAAASSSATGELPDPPQLARDVHFWVRVYTQIDTNEGFLHDQYDLAVIYKTLRFSARAPGWERQRIVDRARRRIASELRQIARAGQALTPQERRIKALWGPRASSAQLLEAADNIRFQLGQSNRFKAGLIRSGAWQHAIARALRREGLPAELAALPLVESSYNPRAYSKDGAAGLWQFMPSTGRRFLTIDRAVDERLDPFSATKAAAQLLAYNHRILGTWPLAITAYNHGVAGVRRAVDTVGTTNIVTVVRRYHTRMFGFASRNFYVSFLAALQVERHARRYFGALHRLPEEHFHDVSMPAYVAVHSLERVLRIGPSRLRELNPALRPLVWNGSLDVPKGYRLRLPASDRQWTAAMITSKLGPARLLASQPVPPSYRVRRGDTLSAIAERYRMGVMVLARYNDIRPGSLLHIGERILLPHKAVPLAAAPPLLAAADKTGDRAPRLHPAVAYELAHAPAPDDAVGIAPAVATGRTPEGLAPAAPRPASVSGDVQPVSDAQAKAISPRLGPAGGPPQSADPTDYTVARNGTIRVAAAESLGYYAEWLHVTAWDLRRLNHLRFRQPVRIGQRIRLDFRHVSRRQFVRQRIAYHRTLEASYFAGHHIEGTELYLTRSGDSLWTLTRRFPMLPSWLLRQYNPDVDFFATLHPGTRLVIPRIETASAGG